MNLIYLRWKDAVADEAGPGTNPLAQLVELEEVGFLLDETDEAIQIGMESHEDEEVQQGRWRLTVPKTNIIELREIDLKKAFPKKSIRPIQLPIEPTE